jgi:hypothetical protein
MRKIAGSFFEGFIFSSFGRRSSVSGFAAQPPDVSRFAPDILRGFAARCAVRLALPLAIQFDSEGLRPDSVAH